MKILVTGAAGFIGFHTCLKLVRQGHEVYGIDNINDYYDPKLKFDRLYELGFSEVESKLFKNEVQSTKFNSLRFSRIDIVDHESIDILFKQEQFEVVCNLAAQAGVRYSIENPKAYIDSNINGFLNILECCLIEISILFLKIAEKRNCQKFVKKFADLEEKGDHLMPGYLKNFAEKQGFAEKDGDYFLNKTNLKVPLPSSNTAK